MDNKKDGKKKGNFLDMVKSLVEDPLEFQLFVNAC